MHTDNVAITITNMSKWFGDFQVLNSIDLTVTKGERIVICGPSGSGKSTLIRCLNHLEEHQKGSILVNSIAVSPGMKNPEKVRRQVGMVFQSFNLFPHLTVLENCMLPQQRALKKTKEEAHEVGMRFFKSSKNPRPSQ